jgi:hypothetical protein
MTPLSRRRPTPATRFSVPKLPASTGPRRPRAMPRACSVTSRRGSTKCAREGGEGDGDGRQSDSPRTSGISCHFAASRLRVTGLSELRKKAHAKTRRREGEKRISREGAKGRRESHAKTRRRTGGSAGPSTAMATSWRSPGAWSEKLRRELCRELCRKVLLGRTFHRQSSRQSSRQRWRIVSHARLHLAPQRQRRDCHLTPGCE